MKKRTKFLLLLALLPALAFANEPVIQADDILGEWTTENEESIFHFYREGDRYFGRVEWQREPCYPEGDEEAGAVRRDRKNPDKSKRNVSLQGYVILKNFRFDKDKWIGGSIYDPQEGNTYKCTMRLKDGKLHVRGYIGVSLLGRTVTWQRPSETLRAYAQANPTHHYAQIITTANEAPASP